MIFTSADIDTAAKAMQESRAWPAVFQAGSAAVLARACLEAVTKSKEKPVSKTKALGLDAQLEVLGAEAVALSTSRRIQTEEGRAIINAHIRLLETLRYGEPKTPAIGESSHHG